MDSITHLRPESEERAAAADELTALMARLEQGDRDALVRLFPHRAAETEACFANGWGI